MTFAAEPPAETGSAGNEEYNRVLEYYVEDGSDLDLVGLIAYGLYKRQKRDWIVKFRAEHAGRKPSGEAVLAVTSNYLTEDVKNTLRNRASDILSGYADTYVQAIEPQIRIEALNAEMLRQAQAIENSIKNQSSFWTQLGVGLVSAAAWSMIVFVLALVVALFGSDILGAVQGVSSFLKS
ncbi:hypothetical protein BTR14_12430 [Rhizobium rhizosphaerae]|uniref:Uncharacterized protein n=1 Tax=Xaviernesmea rhizosphaerae TaxID=1672749 RepID=A0ABX3PCI3_9HYPH|nr:hypothetical protein [Xaviernesmea rhizosphaerae]OQP86186.1 hypothetical protein BTR14_12430 [Xaviernesmea rhizosphaerae]